jgi:Ca-activated chloride channel homolog
MASTRDQRLFLRRVGIIGILLLAYQSTLGTVAPSQAQNDEQLFTLTLGVDEVSLTFHVMDNHGNSIDDLPLSKFQLWDEGTELHRFSGFHFYRDLPVRAGFLFDASGSMEENLRFNEYVANLYASKMLRRGKDRAFVMDFGTDVRLAQDWTDDPNAIAAAIQSISEEDFGHSVTALFDSLYKACRDRWSPSKQEITGNFILLFTDGIDDASHARLKDTIDMCQRTRTSIYIFTNQWNLRGSSPGVKTLEALSSESGGRIFLKPSKEQIAKDVDILDNDLRTQYLLDFMPPKLIRNGSYHRLKLKCGVTGSSVLVRSGYYAISHRN